MRTNIRNYYAATAGIANKTASPYLSNLKSLESTWTQQIIGQLIFQGAEDVPVHEISPWLDLRVMPPETGAMLEAQTHRRFVKTHLPLDALVFSPKAKYI